MTKKRITVSILLYVLIAVITAGLIVGTVYANKYTPIISVYFNHQTSKVVKDKNATGDTAYYKSDFDSAEKLREYGRLLCEDVVAGGIVLLKNDETDGEPALPLKSGAKVSLLGTGSVDFIYGGGGAGSINTKNAPNLRQAMESAGFAVNDKLWDFYSTGAAKGYRRESPDPYGRGNWVVGEAPAAVYTDEVKNSFAEFSDAAVVVIGRAGGESSDLGLTTHTVDGAVSDKHYLELTDEEKDLLAMAAADAFKKTVVILNTANPIEAGFLESAGVDACIWVGPVGETGINAVGKALSGAVNPSGRLPDTFAYDALSAPAMKNFGAFALEGVNKPMMTSYLTYTESIYVGYKYYETRYEDAVLGRGNAGDFDYAEQVQFPFGYGLSYTTFKTDSLTKRTDGDEFVFSATVQNTGSVPGRHVVQLYMQSPYTDYDREHGVEKSAVELVGFAKTGEIAVGGRETVTVVVPREVMRVYDAQGYGTYIADAGTYYFAVGDNAHDALNNILAAKGATVTGDAGLVKTQNQSDLESKTYSTSQETGEAIVNRYSDCDMKYYDSGYRYLSRKDWTGTFPKTYESAAGSGKIVPTAKMKDDIERMYAHYADMEDAQMPVTDKINDEYGQLQLVTFRDADYDDGLWNTLLDQMKPEEMYELVRIGGYSTVAVESVGKKSTVDKDGPAGISATLVGGADAMGYPSEVVIAASFDSALAEKVGRAIGEDGLHTGVAGWYAPAMNIHRTPFSGRNFEYYSEDALLSGQMGAAQVRGVQSKGVYAYIKHFAFNDQETGRMGLATFGSEQALREIYLRPFEISVREGGALAVMTAMNRIGFTWVGAHKPTMTDVLRGEWNFKGFAITDQASFSVFTYMDIKAGLLAGNDMWLNTDTTLHHINGYKTNPTIITALRRASGRILYTASRSQAINGLSSTDRIVKIIPLWKCWLIALDVVLFAAAAAGLFFITFMLVKKSREGKAGSTPRGGDRA